MKILGIEWSSSRRTLAFGQWSADGGMCVLSMAQLPEGRDSRYFQTFQQLSRETGVMKSDIHAVVVGIGPGSYAGIRSAISVAYGWHLANDAKLIGLSSAQVMARKAFELTGQTSLHTLIDAQRGECYHAQFRQMTDGSAREVEPLAIKGTEQLASFVQTGACVVGEDVRRWFPEGTAASVESIDVLPDAASLLKEASGLINQPGCQRLEPIYLRPTSFVKAPPSRIPLSEEELNHL
jgi:tRNA threonylcarbamoyladenosine biosynthesis protein TsaB